MILIVEKHKLFCIPHAGASASVYYKWQRFLDNEMIELIPLELKGRGMRLDEPFYEDFEDMLNDLYEMVTNEINANDKYILFGHSMGAYAAFCLETMLEKNLGKCAEYIFLSGREAPPFWVSGKKYISHLNHHEFLQEIKSYGGIDEKFLGDEDVLAFILPIIRNDFRVIETLDSSDVGEVLQAPIMVLNGKGDNLNPDHVEVWRSFSTAGCEIKYFSGGHFYIDDNLGEIAGYINEISKKILI